jgi:hypothetical protein
LIAPWSSEANQIVTANPQSHYKAVILSEAPRKCYLSNDHLSAESKNPGDACRQTPFGAFRPQTSAALLDRPLVSKTDEIRIGFICSFHTRRLAARRTTSGINLERTDRSASLPASAIHSQHAISGYAFARRYRIHKPGCLPLAIGPFGPRTRSWFGRHAFPQGLLYGLLSSECSILGR